MNEEVGVADMPWVRFPITDELLLTFMNWISWCYLHCRENEFNDLWNRGVIFYDENPGVQMPLPMYPQYRQEKGYPREAEPPPNPFFKDCKVLSHSTDPLDEPAYEQMIGQMPPIPTLRGYRQPTRVACTELNNAAGRVVRLRDEYFTKFRATWETLRTPLPEGAVLSHHRAVNCLRGIEMWSWIMQGAS